MGFLLSLIEEKRDDTMQDAIQKFLTGEDEMPVNTSSGANVTQANSLGVTSVYSAVKLIAWTLASLPLPIYRRLSPRGKERASDHPLYHVLHDAPNPELTSFKWRELMSVHQNLWGAGISEIEFDNLGNPVALWPLPPWRVEPKRTTSNAIYYEITLDNGGKRVLLSYQTLIFPALSTSSYAWMSPISIHRETVGLAKALNEFGAKTFGQGTNPAAIISTAKLNDVSRKNLREDLKQYSGLGNAHRLMLLEEGTKFERVGLPPEDAQYLESRNFEISEIARIYNVPLHLLQNHEKSTSWGSGIEELNIGFVMFTLRPYLVQWEQEMQRRLFGGDNEYFPEFLIEGLLRGKLSERYEAYVKARMNGWMSTNDIREIENMNPLPEKEGGDMYLVPLNCQKLAFAGEKQDKVLATNLK
jgi:HK97 family phage portal protein